MSELERELLMALKGLLPEGWDDGSMDHMPGVRVARIAIANAEGRAIDLEMPTRAVCKAMASFWTKRAELAEASKSDLL